MSNTKKSIQLDHVDLQMILIALSAQKEQYAAVGSDYFTTRADLAGDLITRLETLPRPGWLGYELFPCTTTR
ncbi:MAG: hypothetical protein KC441_17485 [Anaerolineales bacterium]|nr:hypothetical protein [Anaerolineales bacterium]